MRPYRCPDPSHGGEAVPLKANNERVYECENTHKYWRREEGAEVLLVNLISSERYGAEEMPSGTPDEAERPRLNFMVDVPRIRGKLDFNTLSLTPAQWKVISRIDGSSNLEEIRLLAGLNATRTEQIIYELKDAGLVEVRRRGGR